VAAAEPNYDGNYAGIINLSTATDRRLPVMMKVVWTTVARLDLSAAGG